MIHFWRSTGRRISRIPERYELDKNTSIFGNTGPMSQVKHRAGSDFYKSFKNKGRKEELCEHTKDRWILYAAMKILIHDSKKRRRNEI